MDGSVVRCGSAPPSSRSTNPAALRDDHAAATRRRERQLDILRHVSTNHESSVGVLAHVVVPGTIRTGDSPEL